jgi:amino acid adenylation domain-containing protein
LQGASISLREERLQGASISLRDAPMPGGALTAATGVATESAARVATEAAARVATEAAARVATEAVARVANEAAAAGVVERPASEGQRALWFLQRLAPESDAYHVARAFRLLAPPDVGALGRALDALVLRHASLRASFPEREGVPVERVGPRVGPSLQVVDARGWGEDELARRLGEAARQPFDLAEGPLFRAQLFERAEGARLLFCFHHLVIDFGSLGVLASELGALYEAARGGQEPSLPPAGVTPAEFERARGPKGDEREALRRYWRGALAGAPPVLDVPTDRPRPRRPSFVGARLPFTTSAEVAARVKVLAGACDTTVFTTLLAAFALLLRTYTGERDLVVGTPSAGRRSPLVRRSVGYFVNPLTLRLGVDPAQSFRELVRRTRGAVVEALEHGALPFAQLIEALRPAREPGRAPLVQVMFAWQSSPAGAPELGSVAIERAGAQARLGGLELESLALERQGSAFDLSVMMAEGAAGLGGSLEYRSDLFDPASAEAMARHFVALLEAGVGAPDAPVGQLSPLDEGDRRQLRAWAGAEAIASNAAGGVLHRLFEARAAETPGAPALSFRGQTLSYRELDEQANRLAHQLRELGVGAEVRVGVCLERGPDVAIAFWAVLKAGGAYVPLDPGAPPERLGWTAADAGLRLVVTRGEAAARLSFVTASLLRLEHADEAGGAWPTATPSTRVSDRPDSLAYVIYTSGSTGTPKGVMVTHRNAANLARAQRDRLDLRADDRVAQYCPSNFDISIWDMLMAHLSGACLLPIPAEAVPPGPSLVSYFEGERVSVATMLPSVLAALPRAELPALRLLVSGAEVCTPELVERWAPGRTFFNAYGPTEITVCCAFDACTPDGTMPPIGRPVLGATAYVLNEAFEPVPVGAAGELYIGGRGVARGYLGRPALSAERFLPDPFSSEPGARLYQTGDRARWNRRGRLEFLGRLDEQIKLNGFRIEPAEIEARLRDDLGAREAVVLATPGPSGRTRLVAYVSAEGGRRAAREVRARLRARLPEYMLPSAFVWLAALPLLPNGKVDRRALAAMNEAESGPEAPFVAPRDELETSIAGAWAEALGRARAGVREHFFEDLGGGSLDVVKVCALLAERLGREVPLTHLFEHPTVEGLAERLRRDEAGATAPGAGTARAEGRAEARRAALARRGRRGG